ncbi:MAG: glycosyltransferase family 4 protein [Vicinamibacteria bacterium]|nr:glycosyltransferase family 4 protein [Vicinamibacteria bacterium]
MRICHVTPHLPPDQAANALLPYHLGCWARDRGDHVSFVAHPPRASHDQAWATGQLPGPVVWIRTRGSESTLERVLKIGTLKTCLAIWRQAEEAIAAADVVHVHSNGLLAEVGSFLATRANTPVVMTLYGTEIWHYRPRRLGPDLFTRAYQRAAHVTFYSHGLQTRAVELGLARHQTSVVYPPVAAEFVFHDEREQMDARAALGLRQRHVLVNVKRLHPLAGQRFLLEALGEVVRTHPDTRLVICGTGPLLDDLKAVARTNGVEAHVTFTGLVNNQTIAQYDGAADVFVLPSLLEACPTVALEALASGTPVVSTDNPGGVELGEIFGYDVTVVPRENPHALARAIIAVLDQKRRVRESTRRILEQEFRPPAVDRQFREIYNSVLSHSSHPPREGTEGHGIDR